MDAVPACNKNFFKVLGGLRGKVIYSSRWQNKIYRKHLLSLYSLFFFPLTSHQPLPGHFTTNRTSIKYYMKYIV